MTAPTTMVERIAARLADVSLGEGVTLKVALLPWLVSPTKPPPANDPVAAAIGAIVREVLSEAREPTEAMEKAGEVAIDSGDETGYGSYWKQTAAWQAMIDAALKEGE